MNGALERTLAGLPARIADARLQDPWWVIGSAAMALAGIENADPHDVDLLLSERDARAFIAAHGDCVDRAYVPAEGGRFRSRFARFRFAPLPLEVMGGLEVRHDGQWQPVAVAQTRRVRAAGEDIPIPSVHEQIRMFERFGREKDLRKAQRLRQALDSGELHAA